MKPVKEFVRSLLAALGYGIYKKNWGQIIPDIIPDPQHYTEPEDYSRLFRPWRSPEFNRIFHEAITANTMLSPMKLYILRQLLLSAMHVEGDIFEAGTWNGGSARLMLDCVLKKRAPKSFWLLDTFQGYQKIDPSKDGAHAKIEDCKGTSLAEVGALLKNDEVNIHLVAGLIPGTLEQVAASRICFAHIDVNLHEPTAAATDFCIERMPPGGIILFDDYNWPATYGARIAIDSVTEKWGQEIISIPESTQGFLIRQP